MKSLAIINFIRTFRYFASIIFLIASILFLPGEDKLAGYSETALAASDPMIAAAGDIACDPTNSNFNNGNGTTSNCRQKYTSDLLVNASLAAVLPLGDVQYYCGGYQAFLQSYDLSWGRVKSITHPVVGNHEYLTSGGTDCTSANAGAMGYFNYFGTAAGNQGQGYYSYDIGTWHIIAINSNCSDIGGCSPTSLQGKWLEADLNAHSNFCTLAYWHIPLFSSGGRAANNTKDIWQILYNHNADLILSGHDHIYERFAPQTAGGVADPIRGLREIIVGTGGSDHTNIPGAIAANSEVRNIDTYGVLKLTLHPTSYDWQFVPEAGGTFKESGIGACHGDTPDNIPPAVPSNLTASAVAWNQVNLNWTASTDNIAVVGYKVFRDGVEIASVSGLATSYVDTSTQGQTAYSYSVKAVDGVGLTSNFSNPATVTTPVVPAVLTFTSAADAEIQSANPTTNYGSSVQFVVDNSPIKNALLKFNVTGVGTRTILSAKLRLYCIDKSPSGGEFHRTANTTWNEGTVTWNTAPVADTNTLATLGAVAANTWYEVDVASLVTGDGTFSLRMNSTNDDGAAYSSKEGTTGFAPQLVVTTTGPTSTSTYTATSTPTATPINSPTFTPTSSASILFSDGFESGNLSQWTSGQGLVVQNQQVANGSFAARGTSAAGGATYARKLLSASQTDLYYRILFKVISQGANTVNLMKFRTSADTPILSVSINNLGNLSYRNDLTGTSVNSTTSVSSGSWQTLQVHVKIADTASQIEVWYNGTLVSGLTRMDALGTNPIGILQLGENTPALIYDFAFDDVAASLSFISGGTQIATATDTATATQTPTATSTFTSTPTPTNTPTASPSFTPTSTPTLIATNTASATQTIFTFTTVADTYVESGLSTTNFGSATQFVTDNSPVRNMLLKFTVSGIGNKPILGVKLRLYCVDGSPFGGEFHQVMDTSWGESSVNWNNAPSANVGILTSLGKVSASKWYEVDLTPLVTADGTYSLKIISNNSDGAYYSTKEGAAGFAPQLVITIGSASTNTPTNAPTDTPTATQMSFPTPTDTSTSTPMPSDTPIPSDTPTWTSTP